MPDARHVRCPTCRRVGDWFDGEFGPFCSKRCRLIDLGKWLGGEHTLSEPLRPEHIEGYGTLPAGEQDNGTDRGI
jgi:endogenous inhibitor of DNA gyrase (YacG/DUF329 family)